MDTYRNRMYAYWLQSANVGDVLTPFLISRIWGKEAVFASVGSGRMFMGGTVAQNARYGDVLCGCGIFRAGPAPSGCKVLALRGPRTAKRLGVSECVYGDAGLLLPSVYEPRKADRHVLGIVPHYVDASAVSGTSVIPVSLDVPEFIDRVTSCEAIATSSLYGIVIAEAYGIPAIRVRFPSSDQIRDFDWKHADYYEGTERELPPAVTLEDAVHGDRPRHGPDLKKITEALTAAAKSHTV